MNEALRKVLKRLHYPLEIMLMCVLVCCVSAESAAYRGNDARARCVRGSHDHPPLVAQDVAGAGRGSVAIRKSARRKVRSVGCSGGQGIELVGSGCNLPLFEHVHGFDALTGSGIVGKRHLVGSFLS